MKKTTLITLIFSMILSQIIPLCGFAESVSSVDFDSKYENIAKQSKEISLTATHLDGVTDGTKGKELLTRLIDGDRMKGSYLTDYYTRFGKLTFGFKEEVSYNKIVIYDVTRNTKNFTISSSNDGENWQEFYSFDRWEKNWGEPELYCYFPTQTSKYIQINVKDMYTFNESSSFGFCMAEIEIYHTNPVEFYRLDQMIEKANTFLKMAKESEKPYFEDRLKELEEAIETANKARERSDIKQEEIEDHVLTIREKLRLSRDFLNYPKEEYEKAIYNLKRDLTFSDRIFNQEEKEKVAKTVSSTRVIWETMHKDGTSLLWDNVGTVEAARANMDHAPINAILANIKAMAIAATHKESELKGNPQLIADIAYAMDIFSKYWFGPNVPWFGYNFHGHIIGFILKYGDILVYMYDEIDYETLSRLAREVKTQLRPDYVKFNGTNRHDIASGAAKIGAVLREDYLISNYIEGIEQDMVVKDGTFSGDGYYIDGSSVFHKSIPYTGTYNLAACKHVVDAITMTKNTPWIPNEKKIKSFLTKYIEEAYFPLMKNGSLMSMVLGRSIVQTTNVEKSAGHGVANLLYAVGSYLGDPYQTEIFSFLKESFKNAPNSYWKIFDPKYRALLEDDSIPTAKSQVLNKVYRYMDRVVHHRGEWALGLAMSSTRISRFENTQNANKKGWFTGSGMTYFYDDDDIQYSNQYFLAADMKRMPGVTAVNTKMFSLEGYVSGTGQQTTKDFAGGVSLENLYGVAGMEVEQGDVNISARKSYYMFDDEVVMVGSKISSTVKKDPTETTIDQRQVLEDKDNLFINGKSLDTIELKEAKHENVNTVFLQGRTQNSRFGYYFPTPVTLNVNKGSRTHKIKESFQEHDKDVTGTYASFYINHGNGPKNQKYAYAVLPGKTIEETEKYNQNPDIEILADNEYFHSVKEKKLNIVGLTNFENQKASAGGLTVDHASISMVQFKDNEISFAISDPTMLLTEKIRVEIDDSADTVIEKSDRIKVISSFPKIILEIDPINAYGESISIRLSKKNQAVTEKVNFSDIENHWAKQDIEEMVKKGYIKGVSNTEFKPDEEISRAELAALLVRIFSFKQEEYSELNFVDVNPSYWYANDVATVNKNRIMTGYNRKFRPTDSVTREEFSKALSSYFGERNSEAQLLNKFSDQKEISDWALSSVTFCLEQNIMQGKTADTFAPKDLTTRAEAAVILKRVCEYRSD